MVNSSLTLRPSALVLSKAQILGRRTADVRTRGSDKAHMIAIPNAARLRMAQDGSSPMAITAVTRLCFLSPLAFGWPAT